MWIVSVDGVGVNLSVCSSLQVLKYAESYGVRAYQVTEGEAEIYWKVFEGTETQCRDFITNIVMQLNTVRR